MNTQEKIISIVAKQLRISEKDITLDSGIQEDVGADSLDLVEILMAIEAAFDIVVPDNDATEMKTIGDLVKYVESKKS